jgi:hypothetical protein
MTNMLTANTSERQELRALIEEARRHQRRRRLAVLGIAILVIAGVVAYVTSGRGGPAHSTSSSPHGPQAPVVTRAGLARISFTYRDSTTGGCIPDTNSQVTTGVGSIDLVGHSLAFTTVTRGCNVTFSRRQEEEADRWINGVLYLAEQTPGGSTYWTSVPRSQIGSYLGFNPLQSLLTSPWALSVVNLQGGSEHRIGTGAISGQPVIEYAGVSTLLAVENELKSLVDTESVTPTSSDHGPVVPTAGSVPISVDSWRNDKNQILRIQVTEPLYTGVYRDGSDTENAVQVPTAGLSAVAVAPGKPIPPVDAVPTVPLRALRQQSSFEMTLDFSSFGSAPAIVRPG